MGKGFEVAVLGGAGFVGSHLVDRLIDLGYRVTVIDNLSTGFRENIHPDASFELCDIKKINKLDSVFKKNKFYYVFHLAAQINLRDSIKNPINDANENIIGTLNVLKCCVKYDIKKLIYTSTGGAIYCPYEMLPWIEKSATNPRSPYGLSKLTSERYIELYSELHNLDYSILRPANIFGERQSPKGEAGVISIFIDNILNDKDLFIFGTGNQTRDFVYISDVIDAFELLIEKGRGVYNVSSNEEVSVNEIANSLLKVTDSVSSIIYKPAVPRELNRTRLYSRNLELLGWKKKVDFEEGLRRVVSYYF
jgi:UDP-glucose 4-epimerase